MDEQGLRARHRADKIEKYERTHHYQGMPEPKPLAADLDPASFPGETDYYPSISSSHFAFPQPDTSLAPAPSGSHPIQSTDSPERPSTITKRVLDPHLQVMCGPMLRYDNVDSLNRTWMGFCLLVTADTGSIYNPSPILEIRYKSNFEEPHHDNSPSQDPPFQIHQQDVIGERIHVYHGPSDSYSFWRFKLTIPMAERETRIQYSINRGARIGFYIPAINQNFRWVAHSCNGFSAGVDQKAFNGADPVWNDLLEKHQQLPFHLLVGGGDQLYCDPIAKEPELASWIAEKDAEIKKTTQLTEPMRIALDRFFFSHYCNWFRSGAFGKAISCIPMINMLDDHDLIDGFGSYPSDLQLSPVFSEIGNRGYFWFLLFQLFIVDSTDKITIEEGSKSTDSNSNEIHSSLILGAVGPYIRSRSHSILTYLGPNVWILLLDCRSERMKEQVCSPQTYQIIFDTCKQKLSPQVTHLVILLGIPIVYPRMVFAEKILAKKDRFVFKVMKKFNVVPGFHNNYNAEPELLDDMNDHWCAQSHKQERNWFLIECQKLAVEKKLRVTFLSGDVHCAAVGRLFTHGNNIKPEHDPKYMLNIVSSAIVNTPPPAALINVMGMLSGVTHKALSRVQTDEDMIGLFKFDTNGKAMKNARFMARRNYCAVRFIDESGEAEFNLRVEIEQGLGKTKGYPIIVPPPNF